MAQPQPTYEELQEELARLKRQYEREMEQLRGENYDLNVENRHLRRRLYEEHTAEIAEDSDQTMADMDSYNEFAGFEDMDGTAQFEETPDSVKMEKRKITSGKVAIPLQYNVSMDYSYGDIEPSVKKSRSDATLIAGEKRRSSKGEDTSNAVITKPRVSKTNDSELECPECEFRTHSVMSWVDHLRKIHFTTPPLAGLALLCECGHESLSDKHIRTCDGNTTVIRKRDGPTKRLYDEKTTPQCLLCEMYPKTAGGYAAHLHDHHKTNLIQNGIYLLCSCGLEMRSSSDCSKHLEDCNPREFTLHKRDDPKPTTPQCVLCEMYPKTATAYAQHIQRVHKSPLSQNGIYLVCSCGLKVRSNNSPKHLDGCNPRQFTLHKLDDEEPTSPTTPKCVLCEAYPSTTLRYTLHLYSQHKSTLAENGIYLVCSCGLEVRDNHNGLKHVDGCDRRKFILHKLDNE